MSTDTSPANPTRALLLVLALVAALAWTARELNHSRIASDPSHPERGWFSMEPDGHYHMRRLSRALDEGLPIAQTDPRMDSPHGARIPWPPYYAYVAYAVLAPFAPADREQRFEYVEHAVASLPCVFAIVTSMLVAAGAWRLSRAHATSLRAAAALIAGGSFAWLRMSLDYSAPGNGDHHAWVSLLLALLLALVSRAFEAESLASPRTALSLGIASGAVAGMLVGSWVGAFVYVLIVQLALGLVLFAHAHSPRAGTARLGIAFHLALLATLAPAVLTSPWKSDLPWIVVNLSWFHLAQPLVGALVFVPLLGLRASSPALCAWPWIVAGALALAALAVAVGDFELACSVREGFAWVSRANTFMAFVTESQPLLWGQFGGPGAVKHALGFAAFAAPLVALWMLVRAWRTRAWELAPWIVATLVIGAQAVAQRRFAEQLGVPMTLGLGWIAADLAGSRAALRGRSPRLAVALAAALALVALAQWPSIALTLERIAAKQYWVTDGFSQKLRGTRDLYRWLRENSGGSGDSSVLASWDHGHSLEFVADQATIATNFGSYLGEDSYLDPWRFLLEENPAAAEELMERRRARYVLLLSDSTKDLAVMTRLLRPNERGEYLVARAGEFDRPGPRFYRAMFGRLMLGGRVVDLERGQLTGDSLGFLRLVYASPTELGVVPQVPYSNGPFPAGWIWERVAGAFVTARGDPGQTLTLSLDLACASSNMRLSWTASSSVASDGFARVRVPYATDAPSGDTRALGPAAWKLGELSGTVAIPASAVASGGTVAARH